MLPTSATQRMGSVKNVQDKDKDDGLILVGVASGVVLVGVAYPRLFISHLSDCP